MTNKDNVIDLEDLIAETEQKILNNEYYEDCEVEYKNGIVKVRIQPISQAKFRLITQNRAELESAEIYNKILAECIINKHDNKKFTKKQIDELFTGGLALALGLKCLEVSGIDIDQESFR